MARAVTKGICIQRGPFSETSQIVQFLTADLGKIGCIAKGAFRLKNNYLGNFDLLGVSRITLTLPKGMGMALVSQGKLLEGHPRLHRDMEAFASGALLAELLRKSLQEGQPAPELYRLACDTLRALDGQEVPPGHVMFVFQAALLKILGYEPVLSRCAECRLRPAEGSLLVVFADRGGVVCRRCRKEGAEGLKLSWKTSRALMAGMEADPFRSGFPALDRKMISEARSFFELFFQYFLERRINAYAFIRTF